MGALVIRPGDKFALIASQLGGADVAHPSLQIDDDLWVMNSPPISFSDHWRGWLGTIRSEHLEHADLVVMTRAPSASPTVLDGENKRLGDKVGRYFTGLMLSARFSCLDSPLALTGAYIDGEFEVRQASDLPVPVLPPGVHPIDISASALGEAAIVARAIAHMAASGKYRRLFRIIGTYGQTRSEIEALDQVHQYCRCLEGLIVPKPGESLKKFKSRTELFVGPSHHDLMADLYELRSAVEHLNDHLAVEAAGRDERIAMIRKALIAEFLARTCISRILATPALWCHFETDAAFRGFWDLPEATRRGLWGSHVDPRDGISDFVSESIRDHELAL